MSSSTGWIALALAVACTGCQRAGTCEDCAPDLEGLSCQEMCDARARSCDVVSSACASSCHVEESLAARLECAGPAAAQRACATRYADVCGDEDLALVCAPEDEALARCLLRACGSAPDDPACLSLCTTSCEALGRACGDDTTICETTCRSAIASTAAEGCSSEYWAYLECIFVDGAGACGTELSARCSEAAGALDECERGPSQPPTSGGMYAACSATDGCASGSCTTIRTDATSGSMCTIACSTTADCPEQSVHCLQLEGATVGRCVPLCSTDDDCQPGTYCEFQWEPVDGYVYVCVPDV